MAIASHLVDPDAVPVTAHASRPRHSHLDEREIMLAPRFFRPRLRDSWVRPPVPPTQDLP